MNLILIIVFLGMLGVGVGWIDHNGVVRTEAKYKPQITKLEADKKQLKDNYDVVHGDLDACNAKFDDLGRKGDGAKREVAAAKARADALAKINEQQLKDFQRRAAVINTPGTKEQQCDKAKQTMTEASRILHGNTK